MFSVLFNVLFKTLILKPLVQFHGKRLFCQSSWEGLGKVFQIELETTLLKVKRKLKTYIQIWRTQNAI